MSIYIILFITLIIDRLLAFLTSLIFKVKYVPLLINFGINKYHKKFVASFFIVMSILIMILVLINALISQPTEKTFDPYPYWAFVIIMGLIIQQVYFEIKLIKTPKQKTASLTRGFTSILLFLFLLFIIY